jgi:hypothetical protein
MSEHLHVLLKEIHSLENSVKKEIEGAEKALSYQVDKGKISFKKDVIKLHRSFKKNAAMYLLNSRFLVMLTAPVIYFVLIPALLLDLAIFFYQVVCFPIYGIEKVKRKDYFLYDRHKLRYLNIFEKINCEYCAYFNGLVAYMREIASRTEQYWCPIRHAIAIKGAHSRYNYFVSYGDPLVYQKQLEHLRKEMEYRKTHSGASPSK